MAQPHGCSVRSVMDTEHPHDSAGQLRSAGLRVTAARLAILDTVRAGDHMDVDAVTSQVRARLGHVSFQAVYEALHAFTAAGFVRRIEPAGSSVWFVCRGGDNHHHLVCRECGRLTDVDCTIGQAQCLEPAGDAGYLVDEADVTIWGVCPEC